MQNTNIACYSQHKSAAQLIILCNEWSIQTKIIHKMLDNNQQVYEIQGCISNARVLGSFQFSQQLIILLQISTKIKFFGGGRRKKRFKSVQKGFILRSGDLNSEDTGISKNIILVLVWKLWSPGLWFEHWASADLRPYSKSKLEIESKLSEIFPVNFILIHGSILA